MGANDRKLIDGIRSGDPRAHLRLISRYRNKVFFFLLRDLKSEDEAIFVAIEAYIAIIDIVKKPDFDPDKWEKLDLLVWGIVKNKKLVYFREARKQAFRNVQMDITYLERQAIDKGINEYKLDEELLKTKTLEVLETLPEHYKKAFHLRYFKEMDVEEISQIMGLERQRIYEYIAYATKQIRKAFSKKDLLSVFLLIVYIFKF